MISDLMDRLGPDNFSTLQKKGHDRARAHLKVPLFSEKKHCPFLFLCMGPKEMSCSFLCVTKL